ncbi:hypothetical protein RHECNPAF_890044 [Rhizobium etli CNPAF512]|nr:hypothetical protein RHECNPAF_890044 [Rhizobium etli CNPAF512]
MAPQISSARRIAMLWFLRCRDLDLTRRATVASAPNP